MDAWQQTFGSLRLGGLVASDGSWSYDFTFADLRWAIPMMAGESRDVYDEFAELATMANRLYWTRNDRVVRKDGYVLPTPHTYHQLIRAYSSVINPYFLEHGAEEVLAHRNELASAPPSYFNPHTVNLATMFLTGQLPEVQPFEGLVHFADCDFGRERHGEPTMKISNCFWRASGWPRGLLIIPTRPEKSSALLPLAVGGLLAVLGIAAWEAWG